MSEAILEDEDDDLASVDLDIAAFDKEYTCERSFELLPEGEEGPLLQQEDPLEQQRQKKRRFNEHYKAAGVRRGLIRYTLLVLDASEAAEKVDKDFHPNRFTVMVYACRDFIRAFLEQNPLSQIGILLLKGGRSRILSLLSSDPEVHVRRLTSLVELGGDVSLQNGMSQALEILKTVPEHGHREVIFLLSSINTSDPSDISQTLRRLKESRVRVTVVGIKGVVCMHQRIAEETKGDCYIPTSETQLTAYLHELIPAPAALSHNIQATLVRVGFPEKNPDGPRGVAFQGDKLLLTDGGYTCNRCKVRVTDLPNICHVCGLTLVSAPQLARSFHHLAPVQPFEEFLPATEEAQTCYGCCKSLHSGKEMISICSNCEGIFCFDCDMYIHEILHNCPKCCHAL